MGAPYVYDISRLRVKLFVGPLPSSNFFFFYFRIKLEVYDQR